MGTPEIVQSFKRYTVILIEPDKVWEG